MQDTELYRHLLGISAPWTVARVTLDLKAQRVEVFVEREPRSKLACPVCAKELSVYNHAEERSWRHLDSCQFQTFLRARPPRVECPEHGVKQARLPWAEPGSRFTLLFERFALEVLRETSIAGAMSILKIGWETALRFMEKAVERGHASCCSRCDSWASTRRPSSAARTTCPSSAASTRVWSSMCS